MALEPGPPSPSRLPDVPVFSLSHFSGQRCFPLLRSAPTHLRLPASSSWRSLHTLALYRLFCAEEILITTLFDSNERVRHAYRNETRLSLMPVPGLVSPRSLTYARSDIVRSSHMALTTSPLLSHCPSPREVTALRGLRCHLLTLPPFHQRSLSPHLRLGAFPPISFPRAVYHLCGHGGTSMLDHEKMLGTRSGSHMTRSIVSRWTSSFFFEVPSLHPPWSRSHSGLSDALGLQSSGTTHHDTTEWQNI